MTRWMIAVAMLLALGFTSPVGAGQSSSSGEGTPGDGSVHGKIEGVSNTVFTIGVNHGGRRHRRARTSGLEVHFNPETVTITLDGVAVRSLDATASGKYASIVGTMKNNVLEASSIVVTSNPPAHNAKRKSKNG